MHNSAKKQLSGTARALLFMGMFLLSIFALAHALTIKSITIEKVNSGVATKGVLTTQPFGAVNGVAFTTQPVVQLQQVLQ